MAFKPPPPCDRIVTVVAGPTIERLLGEREEAHLVVQLRLFFFIYIRVVRRALNLLRASFSPIFQYFSAVNDTRVSFTPIFHFNIS